MMSYGNDSDRPWALDEEAAEPIIRRAVEGGMPLTLRGLHYEAVGEQEQGERDVVHRRRRRQRRR